jgi:hypothetical protein
MLIKIANVWQLLADSESTFALKHQFLPTDPPYQRMIEKYVCATTQSITSPNRKVIDIHQYDVLLCSIHTCHQACLAQEGWWLIYRRVALESSRHVS